MKILVTTDGSPRSLTALPHAAALARATGSTVTLVRVLDQLMDLGDHTELSGAIYPFTKLHEAGVLRAVGQSLSAQLHPMMNEQ